jgi:hypothetical protein
MRTFLPIFILISVSSFGQRSYTVPKNDFIKQFSDTAKVSRIYCINRKGEKVWLNNARGFRMILTLKNTNKKIKLSGGKYEAGSIIGEKLSPRLVIEKVSTKFDEVSMITIQSPYAIESPYFNLDSCRNLQIFKNDSLSKYYSNRNQVVVYFKSKMEVVPDSLLICENATYNIIFKDNRLIKNGVINKITVDSIFIFSSFNVNTAKQNKEEYKMLNYSLNDITGLQLLKGGGYSWKDISVRDYDLVTTVIEPSKLRPCKFVLNTVSGKIELFRWWLTENGFFWVAETNGKLHWLEK